MHKVHHVAPHQMRREGRLNPASTGWGGGAKFKYTFELLVLQARVLLSQVKQLLKNFGEPGDRDNTAGTR